MAKPNQNKKPQRTLTTPLDYKQARNMAQSEARAEYGPTIRAAKAEKRGSVQRQKNIGQMFQGLQNTIQNSAAQTDASYGQANAALLAHMQAAQNAAASSQSQIAQNNVDLTALTGADPRLTAPSLQEGAAAAGQRDIGRAALAAPIAQAGAAQAAYLRNTGINAQREGIDQKLKEAKRRDLIGQDLTALRKERAQKAVGNFRGIRGEERDYGIQRAAFNLDKQGQALDQANAEASREIDWYNAKTGRQNSQSGGGGDGPDPERRQEQKEAWSAGKSLFEQKEWPSWAAFEKALRKEAGVSAADARKVAAKLRQQWEHDQKVRNGVTKAAGGVNPFN